MISSFEFVVTAVSAELRVIGKNGFIPVDLWAVEAPGPALAGVDLVQRLIAANSAIAEAEVALIEHAAIAALSAREATQLGLPPVAEVVAEVRFDGTIA